MKISTRETSPQLYARIAGALYLAVIALGIFAEAYALSHFRASGDVTILAQTILAEPILWNLSAFANLMLVLCVIPLSWLLYLLLKPVNQNLIVLAIFFNLLSLAIEIISKLMQLLVKPLLTSTSMAKSFEPAQLHALANFALKSHDIAFNIALILFGATCIIYGYLIFASRYLPKLIGILMQIAGVSYLVACFSALFFPAFSNMISPAILFPALVGEASFCLWLLVKGVNLTKWDEWNDQLNAKS
ncbi:DUF4386 domain-containing protein [Undibacterium sp. Ji22W]|uniref:DUF4386 domain-containing protein n=1 Tax=Undibacterium sp. Ji22W TaxID=3413038 RepID=UPI003BF018FB